MKVFVRTVGCQMNQLDSELVSDQLHAAGHEIVDNDDIADVVLLNTCSVRAQAENKIYSYLGREEVRQQETGPRVIAVMGCLAQRRQDDLRKRYSCIDIICGPGQLHRLPELIAQAAKGKRRTACDPDRKQGREAFTSNPHIDELDHSRRPQAQNDTAQAYVRVMRGCDNFCTYCIVPFVRGPEISRKPDAILQEVQSLVNVGRSEITLLGQTVNSYHYAQGATSVRFSDLLQQIASIEGIRRLRFVTSYPTDFGNDILEVMRDYPNICRYIHCPAQSGADRMLKAMNRKYTRAQYDDFIDRTREYLPDVALAGDFIVGFPGETEEDHIASGDLIRRSGYKNSFVFKYSPRPGTIAARTLKDDIPADVKRRRNNELLAIQAEVSLQHHQRLVGKTLEVLVEGPSPRHDKQPTEPADPTHIQLIGRTGGDHITAFYGPADLAGQYARVRITDTATLTLLGEVVK